MKAFIGDDAKYRMQTGVRVLSTTFNKIILLFNKTAIALCWFLFVRGHV
jgi:hypothetical protein